MAESQPLSAAPEGAEYLRAVLRAPVYEAVQVTPLQKMEKLSSRLDNVILVKREDRQPVHSFKLRGAYAMMAGLTDEQKARGVITASAGNHAQGVAFSSARLGLKALIVMLIAPALPCPVRNQVSVEKPDWSTVPFIMADQGPVRRRIELWFRRQKISNPSIYATVSGHEAMVSMVALGCGVALLPEVVLENSPEPVRNRVMILERSDEKTPFELGVCAQKKRLHEPLIDAFWTILPNH